MREGRLTQDDRIYVRFVEQQGPVPYHQEDTSIRKDSQGHGLHGEKQSPLSLCFDTKVHDQFDPKLHKQKEVLNDYV